MSTRPDLPTYTSLREGNGPERKTFWAGYLFGVPVRDFGLFATGIIGIGVGFVAFFVTTFLAIMFTLIWNSNGHQMDFSVTYMYIGFPIGVFFAVISLAYLGMLWIRRQVTRR